MRRWLTASLLVIGGSGCSPISLGDEQRLGVIEHYGDSIDVVLPDAVQVDEPFVLSFHTFGGGCIRRSHTTVDVVSLIAVVTPVDTHSGADICTADLRFLDHTTEVRFRERGSATLLIRGRVEPGGGVLERRFQTTVE